MELNWCVACPLFYGWRGLRPNTPCWWLFSVCHPILHSLLVYSNRLEPNENDRFHQISCSCRRFFFSLSICLSSRDGGNLSPSAVLRESTSSMIFSASGDILPDTRQGLRIFRRNYLLSTLIRIRVGRAFDPHRVTGSLVRDSAILFKQTVSIKSALATTHLISNDVLAAVAIRKTAEEKEEGRKTKDALCCCYRCCDRRRKRRRPRSRRGLILGDRGCGTSQESEKTIVFVSESRAFLGES